jgi:methylthioribulose-1-phosphate dehydratase
MLSHAPLRTHDDARALICELGRRFYALGWVSGTGGGISIRLDDRVFMAPSGVQKELLEPSMIFELTLGGDVVDGPAPSTGFTVSQCRPLFLAAMKLRGAGAVIHGHSRHAVVASLMQPGDFVVTHLEMLKGLAGVGYDDVHAVPVIDNTAHECDLADSLSAAIERAPKAHAVLVRRHGIYVWGRDWIEAKRHAECYDHLFATAADLRSLGIDAAAKPRGP